MRTNEKYVVVCGEFDSEQEAQFYAKLLSAWNIKCAVQEASTGKDQNLTEALMLIAEQLQRNNDSLCELLKNGIRKPFDISKMQTEDEPNTEKKLWDPEKAEELMNTPLSETAKPPLGQIIRSYRLAKNMSQQEAAKKIGVSSVTVSKYESGRVIMKPTFMKFLEPLEIPIDVIQPYLNDFKGDVYHA